MSGFEYGNLLMLHGKWCLRKRNVKILSQRKITAVQSARHNYKKISSLGKQNLKTTGYKISGYMIQV